MGAIEVVQADITRLDVDAIVNAANRDLLGGGGVDGAIHRAAGPDLFEACLAIPEVRRGVRCPTGEARLTPGFRLPARFVIHTVGPVWHGGGSGEPELLESCYERSLGLANDHELRTVAFPAISCGVFGYPIESAASIAVTTLRRVLKGGGSVERVSLVAFGDAVLAALEEAVAAGGDVRKPTD